MLAMSTSTTIMNALQNGGLGFGICRCKEILDFGTKLMTERGSDDDSPRSFWSVPKLQQIIWEPIQLIGFRGARRGMW